MDTSATCLHILLCERAALNERNIITFTNVLPELRLTLTDEEIAELGEPKFAFAPIHIVTCWTRYGGLSESVTIGFSITLSDPTSVNRLPDLESSVTFAVHQRNAYHVIPLEEGLICPLPGTYTFTIAKKGSNEILLNESYELRIFDKIGNSVLVPDRQTPIDAT